MAASRTSWPGFCLIVALYLALLLPTLMRPGLYWDEQVDLDITRSYLAGPGDWFRGSSFDASQTRLPMVAVALVYALIGDRGLAAARCVSALLGALTLLAVHLFCRRFLDSRRGLLACLILATSPFFLSFARIALTESDIFVTCALSWFVLLATILLRDRTAGRGLAAAGMLGLAISAKFTAIALLPVGLLGLAWGARGAGGAGAQPASRPKAGGGTSLAGVALLLCWLCESWWLIWRKGDELSGAAAVGLWAGGILLWGAVAAWQIRRRGEILGAGEGGLFVTGFAAATFLLIPPVHLTNPAILLELARRTFLSAPVSLAFMGQALVFYAGCLIFKSGPLVGAGLLAGLVAALPGWKSRPELRVPLAVFAFYLALLLKMTLAQTFYLMPLLPVLSILASDGFFRMRRRRPVAAAVLAVAAFGWLTVDLALCYPDYNLNGYQYLGARRVAGRSTIGYRGIVQVTTDGVEQALKWASSHVPPGRTVVTYVTAPHIVRAVCPAPPFRIVDGLVGSPGDLRKADYVIIGINATIIDDWGPPADGGEVYRLPYDGRFLETNFRRVFTVRRAFHLEVASVWERDPRVGASLRFPR